jgi:hypothetical protein
MRRILSVPKPVSRLRDLHRMLSFVQATSQKLRGAVIVGMSPLDAVDGSSTGT